jgi:hypothetical protein
MKVYLVIRDGIERSGGDAPGYRLIGIYTEEQQAQHVMADEETRVPSNSNDGWCGYYTMTLGERWPGLLQSEYGRPFNDVEWQEPIQ